MADFLNINKKHFKRNLNSQHFENTITNHKTLVLSCLVKTLPKNCKRVFVTKSCCTYLVKYILNKTFSIKSPVFLVLNKRIKPFDINYYLENFLINKKVKNNLIFFKLFNLCFLHFKESFNFISSINNLRLMFYKFNNNIFKTSIFSSVYV